MEFPLIQTIIRLVVPLLILRFPLPGILLAMLVDMYDWQFIDHSTPEKLSFYQQLDKMLDLYYQLFILFIVFKFKDILAKKAAIGLFLLRMVGLILFYITADRQLLFFFPNVFENFVVLYLLFVYITKKEILFRTKTIVFIVLTVLLVPKLFHEYFMHFLIIQPWEIYNVGSFLNTEGIVAEYINYLSWGAILYVIPMGFLIFLLRKRLGKND